MITREMVQQGYNQGIVKLIFSPNYDGVVCQIGENWFYFGGEEATEYDDVALYKQDIPEDAIIDMIHEALCDFLTIGWEEAKDEYDYYEAYLKEHLLMKRVFISLPMAGKSDEEILDDIRDAREQYRKEHPNEEFEFTDGYTDVDAPTVQHPELYYLGHSILKMRDCDDVIFYGDWKKARGCLVERMVYDLYFAG